MVVSEGAQLDHEEIMQNTYEFETKYTRVHTT